jgi:hypothetical protein
MRNPTPQQTFLVLSMFFGTTPEEREPMQSKVSAQRTERDALVASEILRKVKRGRSQHLVLGDDAGDFVMEHLGAALPKTPSAGKLLSRVLGHLGEFLQTHGHSLEDFMGAAAAKATSREPNHAKSGPTDIVQAVREAYLDLSHGQKRQRIRLADLRRQVAIPADILDRTLLAMQQDGQVVLYKLDNAAEISTEDAHAALLIANEPRHIVYLEA